MNIGCFKKKRKEKPYLQLSRQLQIVSYDKKASLKKDLVTQTVVFGEAVPVGSSLEMQTLHPTSDLLIQSLNFNQLSK